MQNIIKVQKSKEFEIHFIEDNGAIWAEVFENGIYISPAEWPTKVARHVETMVDILINEQWEKL